MPEPQRKERWTTKKYTCPFCFTEHAISDVEFRANSPNCPKEEDEKLKRYERVQAKPMYPVVKPRGEGFKFISRHFMPVEEACMACPQKCGEITRFRICPSCHNALPPKIDDSEDVIISIVGSRASGKSHYIAVLIDELQKRIIPDILGSNFIEMDLDVTNRYLNQYYSYIYKSHVTLGLTDPNLVQKPLIYESELRTKRKTKNLNFIFYDTAGENLVDLKKMTAVNKYICKSAGIIFLVDPIQVDEFRDRLDEETVSRSLNIDLEEVKRNAPEMIIKAVSDMIRNETYTSAGSQIRIPVAVAFSKLDTIRSLLPRGSIVDMPSSLRQTGKYDRNEMASIDSVMRSMLVQFGERKITTAVETNFSNVSYFGLSALGDAPSQSERNQSARISPPRPHRVEDPFVWIMDQIGLVT